MNQQNLLGSITDNGIEEYVANFQPVSVVTLSTAQKASLMRRFSSLLSQQEPNHSSNLLECELVLVKDPLCYL